MKGARARQPADVRIEAADERAWCGQQQLELTPRAFAVLRHLVEHAGRLVTKEELLVAVWHDTVVSDAALTSCIRDLRQALGDSSETPRYIETVHRRGFRFIGPIARPADTHARRPGPHAAAGWLSGLSLAPPTLVGRGAELARLHRLLENARNGQRQLVFVTGEPGIGKTALVEAFLSQIGPDATLRLALGQCVQQYGAGEAYLPLLEALGRLGREAGGEEVVHVLKRYAPTWLTQLPALLSDPDLDAVQRRAQGTTRERMLRELAEAVDALSAEEPLVLVLEDLHWSDSSTIDLLARVAGRREAARLLVVATYRPADVAANAHPLRGVKQELQLHGHCEELPLQYLSGAAVSEYLSRRFAQHQFPSDLALVLHRKTGGNPLFVVNTVDDLIAQGQVREIDGQWGLSVSLRDIASGTPETLWQMVEKQIERLTPDEQAMLAVASVAGAEFSAAVASAGGIEPHDGERRCQALARRGQFLRTAGVAEWPDGTVAGRYAFIHALYQQALYARIPIARRSGLHLQTGERLERAYGPRAGEIAGELAVHFERGRDVGRAVQYRRQAADNALRQHAYREAAEHATQALDALEARPAGQERVQQELALRVMLGTALTAMKGYSAPEVERTYARALELCERADDTPRLFPVLLGLGWFYTVRGPSRAARDIGQRLFAMSKGSDDQAVVLAAHNAMGVAAFYAGEFEEALAHLEQGIALYDPAQHSPNVSVEFRGGLDPGLSCAAHGAWALWILGYPARAAARMEQALALARSIAHPFTLAHASRFATAFHLSRRETPAAQVHHDATFALSTEHGFRLFLEVGKFHRGWLLAEGGRGEDGLAQMRQWVATCRDIRAECLMPTYLAWFAEVIGKIGRTEDGLAVVNEGLEAATQSGYHYWAAELHRLKAVITLRSGAGGASVERDAEASFLEAIEIARRQGAKVFELRAVAGLSRLWADQRKVTEAHALLSGTFDWFTEGFDTPDLSEARSLVDELARRESPGGAQESNATSPPATSPPGRSSARGRSAGAPRPRREGRCGPSA